MQINVPHVLAEMEVAFARYEDALVNKWVCSAFSEIDLTKKLAIAK